ncbi:MAG: biosynthetic peptidoglycan transglycosylase [Spirochaetia bacterium]
MIYRHTYTYKRGAVISALIILFTGALSSAAFLAYFHLVPHVVNRVITSRLDIAAQTYGLELSIRDVRHVGGYEIQLLDIVARDRTNGHYLEIDLLHVSAGPSVWLNPRASIRALEVESSVLHVHESTTGIGLPVPQPSIADKPTLHQAGIFTEGPRAAGGTEHGDISLYISRGLRLLGNNKVPTLTVGELTVSFSSENEVSVFPWDGLRAEELVLGADRVAGSFRFGSRKSHDTPRMPQNALSQIELPEALAFEFVLGGGPADTAGTVQFTPRATLHIGPGAGGLPALHVEMSGAQLSGTGAIELYDVALAARTRSAADASGNRPTAPFFEVPKLRVSLAMNKTFSAAADSLEGWPTNSTVAGLDRSRAWSIDWALEMLTSVELSQPSLRLSIDSQGRYRIPSAGATLDGKAALDAGAALDGEAATMPAESAIVQPEAETKSSSQDLSRIVQRVAAVPRLRVSDAELEVDDSRSLRNARLSSLIHLSEVNLSFRRDSDGTQLQSAGRVLSNGRGTSHNGSTDGSWDINFVQEGGQSPDIDLNIDLPNLTAISQLFGSNVVDRVRKGSFKAKLARIPQQGDTGSLYAGQALLQRAELNLPFLADESFRINDMSYDFHASYDHEAFLPKAKMLQTYVDTPDLSHTHGEILVKEGTLRIGDVDMEFRPGLRGIFENDGLPARAEATLRLPETELQMMLDLIPAPILGPFTGTLLGGTLSGEFELEVPLERLSRMEWISVFEAPDFNVVYLPDAVNVFKLADSFEHAIVDPVLGYTTQITIPAMQPVSNEWMRTNSGMTPQEVKQEPRRAAWFEHLPESPKAEHQPSGRPQPTSSAATPYVRLEEMAHWIPRAVLSGEDSWFFAHHGFDWPALKRAFELNIAEGRVVAGASTISMQLMKNLYLNHDRVAARKFQEAFLVFLVEEVMELPKERMLELYLNIVEFGPEVFGIYEATQHYFEKTPNELDVTEAVWLASILPSPKRYHQQFEHGEVFAWWLERKEQYLASMVRRNRLSEEQYEEALDIKPDFRDGGT